MAPVSFVSTAPHTHNVCHGRRGMVLDDIVHGLQVLCHSSSDHLISDSDLFFHGLLQHRRILRAFFVQLLDLLSSPVSVPSQPAPPSTKCPLRSPSSRFFPHSPICVLHSCSRCRTLRGLPAPAVSPRLSQASSSAFLFLLLPARVFFWSSSSGHSIAAAAESCLSRPGIHLVSSFSLGLQSSSLQLPALVLLSLHWFSPLLVGVGIFTAPRHVVEIRAESVLLPLIRPPPIAVSVPQSSFSRWLDKPHRSYSHQSQALRYWS